MKSLLEYMKHKDGTYVALDLSAESKVQLDNYLSMTLDPMDRVDPDSYHTTIIYSRTPVPDAEKFAGDSAVGFALVKSWEVFPTKNDGKCLVMKLDFPFAERLNRTLTDMGATSDYAEYKPHITIAYDFHGDIDPTTLVRPHFPLFFDKVVVKPLDTDYVPPTKESK
jgi:2'-5' RNA ligase